MKVPSTLRDTQSPRSWLKFGLVLKTVQCKGQVVEAVIDTGAAVTVISPQLAETLVCSLAPWEGPKIIMANGEGP